MADRPLFIDIRHPLLLKANDLVLLTAEDGNIPRRTPGFGLFYRDTCYLSAYELRLHDTAPLQLMSSDEQGIAAQIGLTNRHLATANGEPIPDHAMTLERSFLVLGHDPVFVDTISIRYFGVSRVTLPVSLEFTSTFESMFALRGADGGKRGRMHAPEWDGTALRFAYEGADDVLRTLLVEFSLSPVVAPRTTEQSIAHFELALDPQASQDLIVTCRVDERPVGAEPLASSRAPGDAAALRREKEAAAAALLDGYARVETPSEGFAQVVTRSLADSPCCK